VLSEHTAVKTLVNPLTLDTNVALLPALSATNETQ